MQSQLEAALLGHTTSNLNTTTSSTNLDDDENNYQDEEEGDVEDFVDEEAEGENGQRTGKPFIGSTSTTRTVTLQMLLSADILQPGKGTMTIEYLGQKFVGDLLEDGKIRSQETDIVFASPSAWAIACKRFINPDKKSGCGWASVKYKGKKLDAYKNVWYKKRKEEQNHEREVENSIEMETLTNIKNIVNSTPYHRIVVKHNTIANRTLTHDANTLIECVPFSNLGKIQPFLLSLSTNAALLMDFHCHLTKTEVSGYLAGHWDVNAHNLQVSHAFPCRNSKTDRENASHVESEISKAIEREKLTLVGWYHSHPFAAAAPTLRDVDAQLDYQIKMKGTSDNSYTPCIGIIISPYNYENTSLESSIIAYWVIPPPEAKPNEYGRPMLMSYSVIQDTKLTENVKNEIKKCSDYYKKDELNFINFSERYLNNTLYIEKLKSTLISKFPRDENESTIWRLIRDSIGYYSEENDNLISIPTISKSTLTSSSSATATATSASVAATTTQQLLSNLNQSVNLNTNLMLSTDLSSLLFNSGKFPSASSILGLPDPMAHSTLAANNMFLSTNLFKMQELLKPLSATTTTTSTSSLTSSKLKNDHHSKHSSLKIPNDLMNTTATVGSSGSSSSTTSSSNKNNKNSDLFLTPDFKKSTLTDFNAADLSISSSHSNSKLNKEFTIPDFSKNLLELGEKLPKIPKTDFMTSSPMLDLSMSGKHFDSSFMETATDLSLSHNDSQQQQQHISDDKPLNLASEFNDQNMDSK